MTAALTDIEDRGPSTRLQPSPDAQEFGLPLLAMRPRRQESSGQRHHSRHVCAAYAPGTDFELATRVLAGRRKWSYVHMERSITSSTGT